MDILRSLFGGKESTEPPAPSSRSDQPRPDPVHPRVLAVIHDPIIRSAGGRKVHQVLGWNDPDRLAKGYADDIRWCSDGYANYEITQRIEVDGYPLKLDGYAYDEASYLRAWQTRDFHQPDAVDYLALVREFDLIGKLDRDEIDEVWLLGFPYTGYYESIMAGPDAFWCNAPPLAGTEHAARRFVIMGFNYVRGVGEMLEDLGHRAESILSKVFERRRGESNLFERFLRYDQKYPGQAEVGNVHFAPNSVRDYDWGNPRFVLSRCDDWYHFPDLPGMARRVNCTEWGNGDIREHHRWWLHHLPHIAGQADGIAYNWWQYVIDPNTVIG